MFHSDFLIAIIHIISIIYIRPATSSAVYSYVVLVHFGSSTILDHDEPRLPAHDRPRIGL